MNKDAEKNNEKLWTAYELAFKLGYMIIIPILVFGVGGVMLDKYLNSFPIFLLMGFILAMTSSVVIVYVKMKDIITMGSIKPAGKKTTPVVKAHETPDKQ
jgi:F0F1-type ATP synthase assembly protein I